MKRLLAFFLMCAMLCGGGAAIASDAPAPRAEDPHVLRWLYNPEGGRYAHIDPNCPAVHPDYLPMQQLPAVWPEAMQGPCQSCAAAAAPLCTERGGSVHMPNLQVDVYATELAVPEWEEESVYRLRAVDLDKPDQPMPELLFPSMEGGDGIVPLVRILDMNYDGFPDLVALRAQGASNVRSTFFLYRPEEGEYRYEATLGALSNFSMFPEHGLLHNSVHESASTGSHEFYRVNEGRVWLCRCASMRVEEGGDGFWLRIKVSDFTPAGEEIVLLDEVREPFVDETDERETARRLEELLYDGIPAEVLKVLHGG